MSDISLTVDFMLNAVETARNIEAKYKFFEHIYKTIDADQLPVLKEGKFASGITLNAIICCDWELAGSIKENLELIIRKNPAMADVVLKTAKSFMTDDDETHRSCAFRLSKIGITANPKLADTVLELVTAGIADKDENVREEAQENLQIICENRPELMTPEIVHQVTKYAGSDDNSEARNAAMETFEAISKKRPDLMDVALKKLKSQIAVYHENEAITLDQLANLRFVFEARPDLIDAEWTKSIFQMLPAEQAEATDVSDAVNYTLNFIYDRRPEIAFETGPEEPLKYANKILRAALETANPA